jgi:adenylate cyclase
MSSILKKKLLLSLIMVIVSNLFLLAVYIWLPNAYQALDNRLRDFLFVKRGAVLPTDHVVIVDIDEKSLKTYGQWPWERDLVAKMIDQMNHYYEVGIIGLDIVFAEEDKTSLHYLNKKYDLKINNPPNNDEILAQTLANAPVVAGYSFLMNETTDNVDAPSLPNVFFIERNRDQKEYLFESKGILLNTPLLQYYAPSSGFFNVLPDQSGIIRSVPLIMHYQGEILTSLSLEMIRLIKGVQKVELNYTEDGLNEITLGDLTIPTDRHGRIYVNYRGAQKSFPYISAQDVIEGKADKKALEGKIVLVGTSAAGLLDLRATPYDEAFPGVEVHANIIDNIIQQDFLHRPIDAEGRELFLIIIIFSILGMLYAFVPATVLLLIFLLLGTTLFLLFEYLLFEQGQIINLLHPYLALILVTIGATIVNYFVEARHRTLLNDKFSKKVSAAVVEDILRNPDPTMLLGREKEVSIFFSDVRNFTSISEQLGSAERLIKMLNIYMTPMVDAIVEEKGTVDKFIGDAIMAYWNAPNDVKNHADAAVTASLHQLERLPEVNKKIEKEFGITIDFGMGINTGIATVGEMGSSGRSDYTVIGDSVNLASRLEGLCKPYGVRLIISEFTKVQLQNVYFIRELDLVRVKGKEEPVAIYEVMGFDDDERVDQKKLETYNRALALYKEAKFDQAKLLFDDLNSVQEHKLYAMYSERCQHYIQNPPEDFDGVYTFTTK